MAKSRLRSGTGAEALKHQLVQIVIMILAVSSLGGSVLFFIGVKNRDAVLKKEILRDWKDGRYTDAYEKSLAALEKKPLDSFLLTIHGFVSYQLAVSQINSADTISYLEKSIWSLRKVLLKKFADRNGKVRYVLGRAYYVKGPDYADLSIRYLEEALAAGYRADDIPEYLGLAYASVHEYRKSVETLSLALKPGDSGSDRFLLAIARSYIGLEEWEQARAYLVRCIDQTRDGAEALKARLTLGQVLKDSGDTAGAVALFNEILDMTENAEASYELGELYAAQGDMIRARASWRRSHRADNNYRPARIRLNI